MTPQARSIAAFSLAVLLLTGHLNRLAIAAYVVTGADLSDGDVPRLVMSLLTLVVAAAALWFAHTAAETAPVGWEANLAQAGRLLAAIGVAIGLLNTIAAVTSNQAIYLGPVVLGS